MVKFLSLQNYSVIKFSKPTKLSVYGKLICNGKLYGHQGTIGTVTLLGNGFFTSEFFVDPVWNVNSIKIIVKDNATLSGRSFGFSSNFFGLNILSMGFFSGPGSSKNYFEYSRWKKLSTTNLGIFASVSSSRHFRYWWWVIELWLEPKQCKQYCPTTDKHYRKLWCGSSCSRNCNFWISDRGTLKF